MNIIWHQLMGIYETPSVSRIDLDSYIIKTLCSMLLWCVAF